MWLRNEFSRPFAEKDGRSRRTYLALAMLGLLGAATELTNLPARGDAESKSSVAHQEASEMVALSDLTTRITDLSATMRIVKSDTKELEKIGGDFAFSYKLQGALRAVTLEYKQPDKLRISGKSIIGKASIIMNGPLRYSHHPFQTKKIEDLSASPGKRQSILEYGGLLTPETLTFMQGKFIREEAVEEQPTSVFDLTYKGSTSGSHFRVWLDQKTHVTLKREWYGMEGKLKATFYYQNLKEVASGVWLPTQLEVKNAEGISAAITTMDDVKVNQGLSDELFAIPR